MRQHRLLHFPQAADKFVSLFFSGLIYFNTEFVPGGNGIVPGGFGRAGSKTGGAGNLEVEENIRQSWFAPETIGAWCEWFVHPVLFIRHLENLQGLNAARSSYYWITTLKRRIRFDGEDKDVRIRSQQQTFLIGMKWNRYSNPWFLPFTRLRIVS